MLRFRCAIQETFTNPSPATAHHVSGKFCVHHSFQPLSQADSDFRSKVILLLLLEHAQERLWLIFFSDKNFDRNLEGPKEPTSGSEILTPMTHRSRPRKLKNSATVRIQNKQHEAKRSRRSSLLSAASTQATRLKANRNQIAGSNQKRIATCSQQEIKSPTRRLPTPSQKKVSFWTPKTNVLRTSLAPAHLNHKLPGGYVTHVKQLNTFFFLLQALFDLIVQSPMNKT